MSQFDPSPLPPSSPPVPSYPSIPPALGLADPDSPTVAPRRPWLTVITLALLAAVVILQRPEAPNPQDELDAKLGATVRAPGMSPYILLGKMLVALKKDVPDIASLVRTQLDEPSFGQPSAADEVRIAMLLIGTGAANTQPNPPSPFMMPGAGHDASKPPRTLAQVLDDVEKGLAPESPLHEDITALRPILEIATQDQATEKDVRAAVDQLPEATKAALKSRHSWFAEILFSAGDDTAPVRSRAGTQGMLFLLLVMVVGVIVLVAFLAGIVLLILGMVWKSDGRIRFTFAAPARTGAPEPARLAWSRGLWLETVAIFFLGFLALKLVQEAIHSFFPGADWSVWVTLLGQWTLLACIFWPRIRGLSRTEWKAGIGWHAPQGRLREIGAGFCAYIAGVPIFFAVAFLVVIIMLAIDLIKKAMGMPPSPPPSNRITEIIEAGGPLVLFLFYLLATIWAPIVEESIFRGALYRHLRGRWGFFLAASLSAAAFAAMHPYMLVQLLIIFTLGFNFAIMREWRNSIVPSATAHFIHNSFAMSILLMAGYFMRP